MLPQPGRLGGEPVHGGGVEADYTSHSGMLAASVVAVTGCAQRDRKVSEIALPMRSRLQPLSLRRWRPFLDVHTIASEPNAPKCQALSVRNGLDESLSSLDFRLLHDGDRYRSTLRLCRIIRLLDDDVPHRILVCHAASVSDGPVVPHSINCVEEFAFP